MRFFAFILKLFTVTVRVALIVAPVVALYVLRGDLDPSFVRNNHLHLWTFAWLCVSPFALFLPEIWKATPTAAPVRAASPVAADDDVDGRHFDFMKPGTADYIAFHHGDTNLSAGMAKSDD